MKFKAIGLPLLILTGILLFSCSTPKPAGCPPETAPGNLGEMINSPADEMFPLFFDGKLYYGSNRYGEKHDYSFFSANYIEGEFNVGIEDETFPPNKVGGSAAPAVCYDAGSVPMVFFTARSAGKSVNSNIFHSEINTRGQSSGPLPPVINTEQFEAYPAPAQDCSYMVFSADREDAFGETDLYISYKDESGKWSEPVNLGLGINTEKQEIAPFIGPDNVLYYASKGFGDGGDYDIIRASGSVGSWSNPKKLPEPFNSEADDSNPAIWVDKLLLSSNRAGGCGGHDIYAFQMCGPVIAEGLVRSSDENMRLAGRVQILAGDGSEAFAVDVGDDGAFSVPLAPNSSYDMTYTNPCFPDYEAVQSFETPCSDSSAVKIVVNFALPEFTKEFTFEQYNVPFFVSGYYLPNTTKNLNGLRMKFAYNLIGNDDSTGYIENPGDIYDKYSLVVDEALNEAVDFILESLRYFESSCIGENDALRIVVTGYSDPRPISANSRYSGPEIDNLDFGLQIPRGSAMDNELLSRLRAYFTVKYFQGRLQKKAAYQRFNDRIDWEIRGLGVDEREVLTNELKRRVSVEIGLETE